MICVVSNEMRKEKNPHCDRLRKNRRPEIRLHEKKRKKDICGA